MVTEKLGNYQNNKQTSIKDKEVEPVEPVQIHIYQSNTYRKGLSWLHFEGEPEVQKRQQVNYHLAFVAYLTIPSSSQEQHDKSNPCMAISWIYRVNIKRKKLHRMNQGSNFLQSSFNNRDNIRAPIYLEMKDNHSILKYDFPQEQIHPFLHQQHHCYQTSQMKPVKFFQH